MKEKRRERNNRGKVLGLPVTCYGSDWFWRRHKIVRNVNVQFQKISILPLRRDWNFLGVGWVLFTTKAFKEMCQA